MKLRIHTRMLWALLAASAVIRIVFFLQTKDMPLYSLPILDCEIYHQWALRLVSGNWGWNEAYWMGPLYPHLLALGYRLFGLGHQSVMVVQLVLSLLNIWLVYGLSRSLLGNSPNDSLRNSPRKDNQASQADNTALLAAFMYALYGAPVFYAGLKLMAVMVTTITLLVTWQAVRSTQLETRKNWLILGLLVGLAGLARGNILILLMGFPFLLWQRGSPFFTKKHVVLVLMLWLGGIIMVAPATLRNVIVGRDLVLLTSNGGLNLLIGQEVSHQGMFAPASTTLGPDNEGTMTLELESEAGHTLKGSEISSILTRRAWEKFATNIDVMPLHYARKAVRFWNGYELPQIASYDYWRKEIPALKPLSFPFMVFSALGLLGLIFLPSSENHRGRRVLLIIIFGYFLSLMPFFPTARYRQPLVPLLAISAAVYLFHLARMGMADNPNQARSQTLTHLGLACVAVLAMHPIWMALDSSIVRWQVAMNEAQRGAISGNKAMILEKGHLAEDIIPGMAWTSFRLAENLEEMKDWDTALGYYEKSALINPDQRIIPYRLGRNREKARQYPEALQFFGKALELDPLWAYPYLRTSVILQKLGRKEQALAAVKMAVSRAPGNVKIRSNYGSLLAETGNFLEAENVLQKLTSDFPGYVNGWFNLALVETQRGNNDGALQALLRAESCTGLTEQEHDQILKLRAVLAQ